MPVHGHRVLYQAEDRTSIERFRTQELSGPSLGVIGRRPGRQSRAARPTVIRNCELAKALTVARLDRRLPRNVFT